MNRRGGGAEEAAERVDSRTGSLSDATTLEKTIETVRCRMPKPRETIRQKPPFLQRKRKKTRRPTLSPRTSSAPDSCSYSASSQDSPLAPRCLSSKHDPSSTPSLLEHESKPSSPSQRSPASRHPTRQTSRSYPPLRWLRRFRLRRNVHEGHGGLGDRAIARDEQQRLQG